MTETYCIIRFFESGAKEIVDVGLTRQEALEHVRLPSSHGEGWFEGFEAE